MPIIVATTVVTLDVMLVAVFVTTFWTPPMSLLIRDCTSPVRVRVKKASESRCRWRKTAARRSCMTRWPTWFESSVWATPRTPATIAITIIPAALRETPRVSCASIATRTTPEQERRNHAEAGAHDDQPEQQREPPPVRAEELPDPAHVRAPHLRVGRPLGRRLSSVVEEHPHQRRTTNSESRSIPPRGSAASGLRCPTLGSSWFGDG